MFFFIYGYTYIYNTTFYNCFPKKTNNQESKIKFSGKIKKVKNESISFSSEMLSSYTDTITIGYRTLKSGSAFCGIGIEL